MGAGFGYSTMDEPIVLITVFAALAVFVWAFVVVRKLTREEARARGRVGELEIRLNEAEAALSAESSVLLVWKGRDGFPDKAIGSMHGAARVPETAAELLDFRSWLENDSAAMLEQSLEQLREQGRAFNIGVKTRASELLEADGRTAGSLATLRFRPLAGERRQITELSYDARKLGKQVERLSAVLDAAPMPVWLRAPNGKLAWVNRSYIKAVEAADSDTVLKAGLELARDISPATPAASGAPQPKGRAHAVVAGTMRALDIHELPLAEGSAGFAIDMTALEDTEKELDRHIKAHASTLNKLDTAIAIFGPDQRLRFYNAAYAELWSLDAEWLDGKPADGEILDRLRAKRALPEQANYREWRARQLAAYTTLEPRENWWYLPDGRSVHVICEQHPFGGVTYLYRNVTREIQLESRYNELIGVQRETLDNLEEAVALFGSDGRLKLFNPAFARYWNISLDFLATEPHVEAIAADAARDADDRAAWADIKFGVTALDRERKPIGGQIAAGERTLQYATAPLADGNTLLTFADVSASAKVERALRDRAEALEAADRLKNSFLANVSYEVRTPLTSILGFSETLDLGFLGDLSPKQREYVRDIRRSSEELKAMIDAIIDLSAVDAGQMELRVEPIDVTELLQGVAMRLSGDIERRDLTLNIEVASDAATLPGDRKRIEQVVQNLLSNAIGFSAQGGTIRAGSRRNGADIQIWVSDNGRGIEPEFQRHVFERFQSKPVPGGHRGPGLGLAIVKSFVEMHDGKVALISKVNRGTTVVCSFPADGPRSAHARKSA